MRIIRSFQKLLFVAAVAVVLGIIAACSPDDQESPRAKREWSVLQVVEFESRGRPMSQPIIRRIEEFEVLGVKGRNGENVWVLLRPSSIPYYKQLPSEIEYDVPKTLVDQLVRDGRLSERVTQHLRGREK